MNEATTVRLDFPERFMAGFIERGKCLARTISRTLPELEASQGTWLDLLYAIEMRKMVQASQLVRMIARHLPNNANILNDDQQYFARFTLPNGTIVQVYTDHVIVIFGEDDLRADKLLAATATEIPKEGISIRKPTPQKEEA